MSKITFRADEELVERLERFDASKSEVMREALRAYLDEHEPDRVEFDGADETTLDELVADRIDALLADRLDGATGDGGTQDLNLTISLEGTDPTVREVQPRNTRETHSPSAYDASGAARDVPGARRTRARETLRRDEPRPTRRAERLADRGGRPSDEAPSDGTRDCGKCGEELAADHVYCPNCGEKASNRVFCECGDEVRSDWAFCPGCGRRTPAADVLD